MRRKALALSLSPLIILLLLTIVLKRAGQEAVGQSAAAVDLGRPHFSPAERPRLRDIPDGGTGWNFELINHNPLVNPGQSLPRGGNGNDIVIARNCLYVSSRGNNQGTLILDITDPRATKVVGSIAPPPSPPSNQVLSIADMSGIESLNLLIRQVWNTNAPFDGNKIEILDTSDCLNPTKVSEIPLPDVPHEHFLWQGGNPNRVLLYVGFLSPSRAVAFPAPPRDIDLRVYDVTDKRNPRGPIALWSFQRFGIPAAEPPDPMKNADQGQNNTLHNVIVSPDGTRLYVSQMHAGFFIIDSTPLARNEACDPEPTAARSSDNPFGVNPRACLKKLHPDPEVRLDYHPPYTQMHTHTAVKVPGRPYVVINDEPSGNNCPWSWIWIANVDDTYGFEQASTALFHPIASYGTKYRGDLFPQIQGAFKVPETIVERCPATRLKFPQNQGASFNAHKSLVFQNLFFVSWLAGGVRAVDISNPSVPFETGFFFNKPVARTQAGGVNPELEIRSYPTLRDGLLFFLDGQSGLYILKYTGPRREEIPQKGLFTQAAIQVPGRQP